MWEGRRPASRRAFQAPAWARLFAPPPPKTATTLFTGARVVPPVHHPAGPPLGGPVVAPLLIGRLGHDRRHFARDTRVVERHVGDVARVGVALLPRQHVLRDDLDAHFHGRAAREVD